MISRAFRLLRSSIVLGHRRFICMISLCDIRLFQMKNLPGNFFIDLVLTNNLISNIFASNFQ